MRSSSEAEKRSSRRARLRGSGCWLLLVACLVSGAAACGDEEALPGVEQMTLRELLGLAPERIGEGGEGARRALADRLAGAMSAPPPTEHARVDLEPSAEGSSPLDVVRQFDRERARAGHDALTSARVSDAQGADADPEDAEVTPLPVTLERLGLEVEGVTLRVRPLGADEQVFAGELAADERWGGAEEAALGERSQREALDALEPALRRLLSEAGVSDDGAVQLVAAPQAPLVLWYASEHRALLINPNLLYLLDPADAQDPTPRAVMAVRTSSQALELDFIEACVAAEQERCATCLEAAPEAQSTVCTPRYAADAEETGAEAAARECAELTAPQSEGARLACYNRFVGRHRACLDAAGIDQLCGLTGAPYERVEHLGLLTPMLGDARCQSELQRCHELSAVTPVEPEPEPEPEPIFVPVPSPGPDSVEDDDDLGAVLCAVLEACDSCEDSTGDDDDSSESDDDGLCEGDDAEDDTDSLCGGDDSSSESDDSEGLCEGDSSDASLSRMPIRLHDGDVYLAAAFLFLLGVGWRERSGEDRDRTAGTCA